MSSGLTNKFLLPITAYKLSCFEFKLTVLRALVHKKKTHTLLGKYYIIVVNKVQGDHSYSSDLNINVTGKYLYTFLEIKAKPSANSLQDY